MNLTYQLAASFQVNLADESKVEYPVEKIEADIKQSVGIKKLQLFVNNLDAGNCSQVADVLNLGKFSFILKEVDFLTRQGSVYVPGKFGSSFRNDTFVAGADFNDICFRILNCKAFKNLVEDKISALISDQGLIFTLGDGKDGEILYYLFDFLSFSNGNIKTVDRDKYYIGLTGDAVIVLTRLRDKWKPFIRAPFLNVHIEFATKRDSDNQNIEVRDMAENAKITK